MAAARSLRAHLLRMLLPPVAVLLGLGAILAYYPSIEPAGIKIRTVRGFGYMLEEFKGS